jgi:hypothetical protein
MRPILKSILAGSVSALLVAVIGVTFAARDGSGNYSLPAGNPVSTGSTISSTWANSTLADIATALTNSLAKDGQTVPTANLPMGTFKHTNVGTASARNQYATAGQVQDFSLQTLGTVSGTNSVTGSLNPAIVSYAAGMVIGFTPANNNTGATTLAVNGLTALDVQKFDGDALASGDLVAGIPAVLVLDSGGDDWILLNPQTADMTAATILARLMTVDGSSSSLDADLLDGQHGSFYQDADNLNAGTLANARVAQSNVTQHQAALTLAASQTTSGTFSDDRIATTDSFTGTLTGMSSSTTGTVNWRKVGGVVELWITSAITGTSNATSLTLTGLPSAVQPTSAVGLLPTVTIDNGSSGLSFASISAGGSTISFTYSFVSGTKVFSGVDQYTASGTKGLPIGWRIRYTVD